VLIHLLVSRLHCMNSIFVKNHKNTKEKCMSARFMSHFNDHISHKMTQSIVSHRFQRFSQACSSSIHSTERYIITGFIIYNILTTLLLQNVVVEWLILLCRILDVPGSSLGRVTGYPAFFVALINPRKMPGWYLKSDHGHFLQHPFYFIFHILSFYLTLYSVS
jgi:hypothetical protein